ncbi:transposase family protein [Streptomyces sp. NPDC056323]|uniref:transposase family protein n=1 Tax=unclassified Streptomyces TaxID=2593676 RepID=UPI0035DADE94
MPADASSPITCAFDQLGERLEVVSEEVPSLLERLAEVPDPRDPRGVRHRLTVVLVLTVCAVLAEATSLLAVGEWIADAPAHALEQVGARRDPLLPRRVLLSETTVRRLLARIDGDALDRAVGRWLADRRSDLAEVRTALKERAGTTPLDKFAVNLNAQDQDHLVGLEATVNDVVGVSTAEARRGPG